MKRFYYSSSISKFLSTNSDEVIGILVKSNEFSLEQTQRNAWIEEVTILQKALQNHNGSIYFEFSIPRMGKRIDVLCIIGAVIFVIEFKIGEKQFLSSALDQVMDYGLDLKNFHETSHDKFIAPILVASEAKSIPNQLLFTPHNDQIFIPFKCNNVDLSRVIMEIISFVNQPIIDSSDWESGRYCPTPTIVEAAMALYRGHSVSEISRSDASAINLSQTSDAISEIIYHSKENSQKSICFVTGVPGAGKTLIGLNIATKHIDRNNELYSVFLSGNGPLVSILREALTRDKVKNEKESGKHVKKGEIKSEVKMFIQNVHNFRDDCLIDLEKEPIEHVVLFDEAQRAWNLDQTKNFMSRKKNIHNFGFSEPEFLISCIDRHKDWAVIVCLVGGGQEINTGEAGMSEWINAIDRSFKKWHIYISPKLLDIEYGAENTINKVKNLPNIIHNENLHLSVSMRSFRAEDVSLLVKQLLDLDVNGTQITLNKIKNKYPIVLTRNIIKAKNWLKEKARGTERFGIVVSSQALRLKPYAIDVKSPMDPVHWFLDGKEDIRSSYFLEDVATEFDVQGLELDWTCVTWDADFRYTTNGWEHKSFVGYQWQKIIKPDRQMFQKNAYRVLLTRARQGMVIFVPEGDSNDQTRKPEYYDSTFNYLKGIGFEII